jgi:hypothetical protein
MQRSSFFKACHGSSSPYLADVITASLQWLLEAALILLAYFYSSVAVNLQFACNFDDIINIHPLNAHLIIAIVCMKHVLYNFFPYAVVRDAVNTVKNNVAKRWGDRIHLFGLFFIFKTKCLF